MQINKQLLNKIMTEWQILKQILTKKKEVNREKKNRKKGKNGLIRLEKNQSVESMTSFH